MSRSSDIHLRQVIHDSTNQKENIIILTVIKSQNDFLLKLIQKIFVWIHAVVCGKIIFDSQYRMYQPLTILNFAYSFIFVLIYLALLSLVHRPQVITVPAIPHLRMKQACHCLILVILQRPGFSV